MRCYICDVPLMPSEIKMDSTGAWQPCDICLDVAKDVLVQFTTEDEDDPIVVVEVKGAYLTRIF